MALLSPPFSLCTTFIGDRQYPPQSAPTQVPQETSDFVDGSWPIFSMYMEMATEEDKKMVEDWKADAEGILIFVRLYLFYRISYRLTSHRLVYSLLLSLR